MSEIITNESRALVKVVTLPEIETTITQIMPFIAARCEEASKAVCTEESRQSVKTLRAQLNKESKDLKEQFKTAMSEVKAPIIATENLFKECMSAYSNADLVLKEQISRVENGIKAKKEAEIKEYFNEYAASVELEGIPFEKAVSKVNMSDSVKKYKERIKAFLDGIKRDIELINLEEHRDEMLIEYNKSYDLTNAILVVKNRHKAIEEARKLREAAQTKQPAADEPKTPTPEANTVTETIVVAEPEPITAGPLSAPTAEPEVIRLTFGIYGTLEQLKAFKPELIELIERHGLRYE